MLTDTALWISLLLPNFEKLYKKLKPVPNVPLLQSGPDGRGRGSSVLQHRCNISAHCSAWSQFHVAAVKVKHEQEALPIAGSHLRIDFWESYSCLGFCYFIIYHCDRKTNHLVLLAFRSAAVFSLRGLKRHRGDIDATSAKWKEEPWNAIKLLWLEAAKAAHSKIICNNKNR